MPFTKTSASADTCILSDFLSQERLQLIWDLFPEGVWIDTGALHELQDQFGTAVEAQMRDLGCTPLVERGFAADHYLEMAEIKRRRPALRHPDIMSVVLASMHRATCLSSDNAVRKTCRERGVPVAGHLGCLETAVGRGLLDADEARQLLQSFLNNGLFLGQDLIDGFLGP